jgi:hypothetical protein
MADGNFVLDRGYDLAAGQTVTKFRAVKYSGVADEVTPITGITDDIAGWAQNGVTAAELLKGKGVSTRLLGLTEAEASVAIAIGARVTLDADGRVSTLVGASGKRIVGRCVGNAATNAGDRITLLIVHGLGVA